MEMSEKKKTDRDRQKINDSLAEFLRFNEDVEVGFFELLCEHTEDIRGGREISQVVNDQVKQQLHGEITERQKHSKMKNHNNNNNY